MPMVAACRSATFRANPRRLGVQRSDGVTSGLGIVLRRRGLQACYMVILIADSKAVGHNVADKERSILDFAPEQQTAVAEKRRGDDDRITRAAAKKTGADKLKPCVK